VIFQEIDNAASELNEHIERKKIAIAKDAEEREEKATKEKRTNPKVKMRQRDFLKHDQWK